MAKATGKAANKKAEASGTVTIKELAEQLDAEPRILRQFIRGLGMKAPETKQEGFGPRAKYEWPADSADLKKIIKAWEEKEAAAASGE